MKKYVFFIMFALLASQIMACSSIRSLYSDDKYVEMGPAKPDSFPVLKAIGYAPLSQNSKNKEQRMLKAMEASKLAAYKELAEQVYGINLTSSTKVKDWIVQGSSTLEASFSGLITGARVVKSYPLGNFYVTELELDFETVWALYQNQPQNQPQTVKQVTYF